MMTVDEAYEKDEKQPRPKGKPTWYDIREQQEEQVNNGLASMLLSRNMTGEQRLKALEGLATIYINIPDSDGVKSVIDDFASHICHKCGEICTESTDYERDDTYIICSGGSRIQFKDESKGAGNSMEEFKNNITYSKSNDCGNKGMESMGITWIVDRLLKNIRRRELRAGCID
jgi:hypothetical protein